MSTVSKALRLVRLMQLFEQRSWTRRELAAELGVSLRAIERDMADLRAEPFYVPLWYDDGRWHLLRDGGWRAPRCGALQSERAEGADTEERQGGGHMEQPSSPGLWYCKACGKLLGAMTPARRLWLDAGVVDLAQRYTNAVRVVCACGEVNVWYLKRPVGQALDDAENL